jgi:NarL family two-component system response regulator LiaR
MNTSKRTIRVLIADDHPVTRQGIHAILEEASDIEIVGEAKDGTEAKQMVAKLDPDVLLLDLVMPGLRACEIEARVRTNCPATVTLVLTGHDRDYYLAKALEAEVAGFLTKEEAPERLAEAIRCAARGEILITGGPLARAKRWREEAGARWKSLTQREQEVLRLLVDGQSTQQIAETLSVSDRTVRTHIGNILGKLGVASRSEAIAWAWRYGVVEEIASSGSWSDWSNLVRRPEKNSQFDDARSQKM